jgi:hypothetical protein
VPKSETVRFDGRTISEVRKKFRQWYEDNRAKVSIVNEHDIEGCNPACKQVDATISLTATKTSIRCWSNTRGVGTRVCFSTRNFPFHHCWRRPGFGIRRVRSDLSLQRALVCE